MVRKDRGKICYDACFSPDVLLCCRCCFAIRTSSQLSNAILIHNRIVLDIACRLSLLFVDYRALFLTAKTPAGSQNHK